MKTSHLFVDDDKLRKWPYNEGIAISLKHKTSSIALSKRAFIQKKSNYEELDNFLAEACDVCPQVCLRNVTLDGNVPVPQYNGAFKMCDVKERVSVYRLHVEFESLWRYVGCDLPDEDGKVDESSIEKFREFLSKCNVHKLSIHFSNDSDATMRILNSDIKNCLPRSIDHLTFT